MANVLILYLIRCYFSWKWIWWFSVLRDHTEKVFWSYVWFCHYWI